MLYLKKKKETQDALVKLDEMVLKNINDSKDESINLTGTVIQNLPKDNERLRNDQDQYKTE